MGRELFTSHALEVAPNLLGARISTVTPAGEVTVRITEVEAYHGVGVPGRYDPGSHSRDRRTDRNASMFGPPGHAYVYLNYGMHFALNMVCSPDGVASGVLIRSGVVEAGENLARARRETKRGGAGVAPLASHLLARGPGNLASALGIVRDGYDGRDLFEAPFRFEAAGDVPSVIMTGPRVGVAGEAGGPSFPWRFWVPGDPTVSAFRRGRGAPNS